MTHAFHTTQRKNFTPQQRAKVFLDNEGTCSQCTRKLTSKDDWIVEHETALENGGSNEASNLKITCLWCKPKKDAVDHKIAAKTRHKATKHVVPGKHRKTGFATNKNSKYKKRMDGTVERRDQ